MPYLNSKIEKHNDDCREPSAKRLYIRDYDDKGKQRFVPYGVTCPSCGFLAVEKYQRKPTAIQLKKYKFDREYTLEQFEKFATIDLNNMIKVFTHPSPKVRRESFKNWVKELENAGMTYFDTLRYIKKNFDKKYPDPDQNIVSEMNPEFRNALDNIFSFQR